MVPPDDGSSIDMIRESARHIASRRDLGRVRALRFTAPGFDRALWREMCDLGWPALLLPEEKGGVGLGMRAYCALAEELGAGLVPEPLIPAVLAASLLDGEALERHICGERLVLPAWQDSRDAVAPVAPLALDAGRLTAVKQNVPVAAAADDFIVIGRTQAVLVAAGAAGVEIHPRETQDGAHLARVSFEASPGAVIVADPAPALAQAALATGAYLLGLMDAALDMTIGYLKTRVQFGRPIGSFQALQHLAVDLRLEVELTRASVEAAAAEWDRDGPTGAACAAVSRAKARASQAALKVTRDAIQLHGGIGFTDEHDIGLYLRKALVVAGQHGSARAHRARYAGLRPVKQEA